jgi:hypothetical protein
MFVHSFAFSKAADGSLTFDDNAKAYNAIYDVNRSNHRSWLGESLAEVLAKVRRQ